MRLKPLFGLAPRPKGLANASHEVSAKAYRDPYPLGQPRRRREEFPHLQFRFVTVDVVECEA